MSEYRRLRVPGGTYYFSACLADPDSQLLTDRIGLLRDVVRLTRKRMPFAIPCAVILPSEMQLIWTLPPGDDDFPARWRLLKSTFTRHVAERPGPSPSQARRGEAGLWQRRYWEHLIRDNADYEAHCRQMLAAPVRAGLVRRPEDWPYSSVSRHGFVPSWPMPTRPRLRVA